MANKNEIDRKGMDSITSSRDFVDAIGHKVGELMAEGDLVLPSDYSPQNALKSAYLKLQETVDKSKAPILSTCSKSSVYNALMDMVVQGLSPAKNQCYFIAYNKQLTLMRSYMGTVAVAKRLGGIEDVYAYCLYEGDIFETEFDPESSLIRVINYEPEFKNIDIKKVIGAFAILKRKGKPDYVEVMTIAQIKNAWNQGAGASKAHQNFTDEMAKKTVINRACKMFINTSNDSEILTDAFSRTSANEYEDEDTKKSDKSNGAKAMEDILFGTDGVIDVDSTPVNDDEVTEDNPAFAGTENPFEGEPEEVADEKEQ